MQRLSTAFLIYALAIVVNQVGATAHFYTYEEKTDQLATEAKNRAVTIIDGPKYVAPPSTPAPTAPAPANTTQPERRPPSKPPINPTPDKHGKPKYVYIGPIQNLSHLRNPYQKPVKVHANSVYQYQKVIPLPPNRNVVYPKHQQLVFAASTSKPLIFNKSPKFNLPIETINGIRADVVRPPHFINTTTTSTTTAATTTTKYLRTKRIWPKRMLDKLNATNTTGNNTNTSTNYSNTDNELSSSASSHKIKVILSENASIGASTAGPSTRPPYRRVTRVPKKKSTTPSPANYSTFEPNDWVPIVPSHYPVKKVRKPTPIRSRRSDRSEVYLMNEPNESPAQNKRMMFLQSFGLVPVASSQTPTADSTASRKSIIYVGKTKQLKPHVYSGYRGKPVVHKAQYNGAYQADESNPDKVLTRIKHHHHHHHHRYIKTVEKPVRVEVPKPVPVPVPMPVPVKVEHKVPYPVQVKVPHPVPVKVIEKQYIPKPYPVVQQVPVIRHVEVKVPQPVPVHVEKKVPYPVEVPVPKPYPVAVPVEKKVPYPVPVRILVPQPYPVETKVPVHVKEPVEVIKHVPVKVPVPQPYPVRVPHPVPVPYEKKVPYPVEVEKKVPVPYRVLVPEKVEVEKQVPVYVPRPFPVEKRVPVPVKVPYPVRIPFRVPVGIPILVHPSPGSDEHVVSSGVTVANDGENNQQQQNKLTHYAFAVTGNTVTTSPQNTVTVHSNGNQGTEHLNNINSIINTITDSPQQTVTVHGTPAFQRLGLGQGFQSRSDTFDETTTLYSTTLNTNPENSSPENTSSSTESILTDFLNIIVVPDSNTTLSNPDLR